MGISDWLIEALRGRHSDRVKAQWHVAQAAEAALRESMKDYDAFIPYMKAVVEPAITIGTAAESTGNEVPVRLNLEELHCHGLIQGSTGSGKTSLVNLILTSSLSRQYPAGIIDCKAELFDSALRSAAALAYRMERKQQEAFIQTLAVVNPFSNALVPLNVCKLLPGTTSEVQAFNVSIALTQLFSSDFGFQMEHILKNLILLLIEADLTLAEAPEIMQDELLRGILAQRSRNETIKEFFLRDYPSLREISKTALLSRIQSLLLPENLKLMLGADELVDLKKILDRGHPLFVFLGKGQGVPEEQVELIGSLILQLLFQAAFSTESGKRRHYHIFLDEFFHLLDAPALEKRFKTALVSLRSFGVGLWLVMHEFGQVSATLKDSILTNCDLMAIFRTQYPQYFGEFLPDVDPEIAGRSQRKTGEPPSRSEIRAGLIGRLQNLPAQHCYWRDKRKPYKALLVRVAHVPGPHETAGISEAALENFIADSRYTLGGYALSKETLRRQIEARKNRLREIVRPSIKINISADKNPEEKYMESSGSRKGRKPNLG